MKRMSVLELIRDIGATFPSIPSQMRNTANGKAWMIGAEPDAVMPDRMPVFGGFEDDGYTFGIHDAFVQWLANRGFYLESYDGFWHQPFALPTEAQRFVVVPRPRDIGFTYDCPF